MRCSLVESDCRDELPAVASLVTFPRPPLRRRIVNAVHVALQVSGAASVFAKAHAEGGAMILVYHGIVSDDDAPYVDPRFSVPFNAFLEQVRFLSVERHVLSLGDLLGLLAAGRPVPPRSVVITFDDGYLSTLQRAAPVLQYYDLPAVLYLPTSQVTSAASQFADVLYAAFNLRTRNVLELPLQGFAHVILANPLVVRRAYLGLEQALSRTEPEQREFILCDVLDQLRPKRPFRRLTMDWEEVAKLRSIHPTMEIGVHTSHHVDLTSCKAERVSLELAACIDDVCDALGHRPRHFSFPYGRSNPSVRAAVAAANLESAVVTEPPALVRPGADRFALPRLMAPRDMSLFPFFTSGAYPDLPMAVLGGRA